MKVTALAGGVGAARFLRGLVRVVDDVTVVVNTGDDLQLYGLHVSPDLDSITYTLGGGVHPEQQWGRADETFAVAGELQERYGRSRWFTLGDRDIATHLVRTELLAAGETLTTATATITRAWGLQAVLLPMTDDPVTTHIHTTDGRRLHFQRWWVAEHAAPAVARIEYDGAEAARPAPGVLEAIAAADAVLLCPSNPVVSIGTILAVPGIRQALRRATVVGVSPIVGGAVVRGMADKLLPAIGCDVSAAAVAGLYRDFLDGWLLDDVDAAEAARVPPEVRTATAQTIMHDPDVAADVARAALDLAREMGAQRGGRAS